MKWRSAPPFFFPKRRAESTDKLSIFAAAQSRRDQIMLKVETIEGDQLRADACLCASIHQLSSPSYVDPTAILQREITECTKAFLARDAQDELVCFYLTAWHSLSVQGQDVSAVHLGLSATRQDTKHSGYIGALYSRCIQDVLRLQRASGVRRILWSTTASPTVYLAVIHFLADAEPRRDGSFSNFGDRVARSLRLRLGAMAPDAGEHPFVVKGIAAGTQYSPQERQRIDRVRRLKRFTLFDQLGVDETRQDRLIFIARAPDDFRSRT